MRTLIAATTALLLARFVASASGERAHLGIYSTVALATLI